MQLTEFEWKLILTAAAVVFAMLGFLLKYSKDKLEDKMKELNKQDCDLAKLIDKQNENFTKNNGDITRLISCVVEKLNAHEKWAITEHTLFVSKEDYRDDLKDVKIRMDSYHVRMDEYRDALNDGMNEIKKMLSDIKASAVTREFCNERHEANRQ